ncbi:hypothetical protein [Paracoccus haematequi]|uniref:hypothetical protein n=1 Tax=Paracoccus haematequi TaxID=2491866 RepID=UPI000F7D705C|nr:hypothetical protein [Paracoccus haematequi]
MTAVKSRAAELAELLQLRISGMTTAEMALKLGITRVAICNRLEQAGIPMSQPISPRAAVRSCLSCSRPFISTQPAHRICDCCRS